MTYTVRSGDSLSSIAWRTLGDAERWREIARLNGIDRGDVILVGQVLRIPARASAPIAHPMASAKPTGRLPHGQGGTTPSMVPGRFYLFVVADEINPLRGKVIRRVIVNPRMAADVSARLGRTVPTFPNPERWGFAPKGPPNSTITVGRHVEGMTGKSPFLSASRAKPLGATRFNGRPFWIDEAKARASGATFHETDEIVAGLNDILSRTKDAAKRAELIELLRKVPSDHEVLMRGAIPATAIKGPLAMGMTRGLQGVQIIGLAVSAYDLEQAGEKSHRTHSMRPLAAETVRQAGGWAMAMAGAKLGAMGGAAVGIETGPGAVLTALGGSIVGGVAGYYGFDWIADHIDKN